MSDGKSIQPDDLMLEHVEVSDPASETGEAAAGPVKTDDESLDDYIENIEKKMLEDALKKAKYNKTRAAELLGISFRSFRYKLKKFEID
jgi:two-component system response regulator PilR (NtrC family)